MTPHRNIWELWDADELVSLHLAEQDARDAREQHLDRYRDFPDDDDLVQAAVEIRVTSPSDRRHADHEGPRRLAEAIDDLRGLIAAFDDVRPDDMTAVFYIHAFNQLIESDRQLLEALETGSTA